MPRKTKPTDEQLDLLRTMLIVQLRLAGVPQRNIAKIARCDTNFVSKVIKQIPQKIIAAQSLEA